jgi:hypothetical protein
VRARHRVWLAPSCRVLYVQVLKVASSSVLWALARAEGDPDKKLHLSRSSKTVATVVHDPAVNGLTSLDDASATLRREALTSSRWLRVALTRNPFTRLVAAWHYTEVLEPEPFRVSKVPMARTTTGRIDFNTSFSHFVPALDSDWDEITRCYAYYTPQTEIFAENDVNLTHVVPVENMDSLGAVLAAHDERLSGVIGQVNPGPAFDPYSLYGERSTEIVRRRYESDFKAFNYDRDIVEPTVPLSPLDPMAERLLQEVHDRSRRLHLLYESLGLHDQPRLDA